MNKKLNAKTSWIYSLFVAIKDKEKELTFITTAGIIVGELHEIQSIQSESLEAIKEELKLVGSIDYVSLANAYFKYVVNCNLEKGYDYEDQNLRINLKNARVYLNGHTDKGIPCETIALFSDQIVAVVPGSYSGSKD